MVGLPINKTDVDLTAGSMARDLIVAVNHVANFKTWLDGQLDADLTALGYSAGDISNLRSAFVDAAQLATIFKGTATLGVAKDFAVFLKRLAGLGQIA
jgi:hypothetical protein